MATPKVNEQGFTADEQAEMDAAGENEDAVGEAEEVEGAEPEAVEPAPAASTEPGAAAKPGDKGAKPPSGYVPQAALHEARKEGQELRERMARMETLWQQSQAERRQEAARVQQQAQQGQIPDFDSDPIGHLRAQNAILEQNMRQMQGQSQESMRQQEEARQTHAMLENYAAQTREFAKTAPDRDDAYQFLVDHRDKELQALGFADPVQRQARLQYEEGFIAANAMRQGLNPAAAMYEAAKLRGYVKKGSAVGDERLARIVKGQKNSASLGAVKGAGEGDGGLSLEALASMSGEEFDKAWEKARKSGLLGTG
jgi:hypothetical protein